MRLLFSSVFKVENLQNQHLPAVLFHSFRGRQSQSSDLRTYCQSLRIDGQTGLLRRIASLIYWGKNQLVALSRSPGKGAPAVAPEMGPVVAAAESSVAPSGAAGFAAVGGASVPLLREHLLPRDGAVTHPR